MSNDDIAEWKAFSLTHVEYLEGDYYGLILAVSSLLPIFIIVGFVTLILFRRDLHTIFFFLGIIINEGINLALKRLIAHPRPYRHSNLYTEYGMPSSHSQMMWFFTSYAIEFLMFRLCHSSSSTFQATWKTVMSTLLIFSSCLVSYSRIYLLYHTWSQVIWGMVAGVALGSFWFIIVHLLLTPFFPIMASWRFCEVLLIRDTSLIPNILWFEYTQARAENRTRNRKLVSMKSQ